MRLPALISLLAAAASSAAAVAAPAVPRAAPSSCPARSEGDAPPSARGGSEDVPAPGQGVGDGGGDGDGGGYGGGGGGGAAADSVLSEIRSALAASESAVNGDDDPTTGAAVASAVRDFAPLDGSNPAAGSSARRFLGALSSSPTFVREFWSRRPLLIRSDDGVGTGDWVGGCFTVERDLRMIDGSYISGHRTADVLRNGTKTDTWEFRPLKDDPTRKTTWEEVQTALSGGTVYFNTAGSLWPTLGALCRLTSYAFGLPTNVNVYVTPPGVTTSVPPHTDKQDVLAFQSQGAKRWRVYAPPKRKKGVDPLGRGKGGDVLGFDEMGPPLIDAVIRRGDVLYVPAGFPHTTDTITVVDDDSGGAPGDMFDETSVHLTMGLDTHVWFLTLAHLRWSLLHRAGKGFRIDDMDDGAYWESMRAPPVGFLGGEGGMRSLESLRRTGTPDGESVGALVRELKRVMIQLEPCRWRTGDRDDGCEEDRGREREDLPSDGEFRQVAEYVLGEHLRSLLELQEEMFGNVDPHSEESLVKAYRCTQRQNEIMERFGAFSKNDAMREAFARSRLQREAMTKGL